MSLSARWKTKSARLIGKGGALGLLRRTGSTDRKVMCAITNYSVQQQQLRADNARRALLSPFNPETGALLDPPPDHLLDKLVFAGQVHRIVRPDEGPRPQGETIYHDLEVVYDSGDV